jgi:hypothetical protein
MISETKAEMDARHARERFAFEQWRTAYRRALEEQHSPSRQWALVLFHARRLASILIRAAANAVIYFNFTQTKDNQCLRSTKT